MPPPKSAHTKPGPVSVATASAKPAVAATVPAILRVRCVARVKNKRPTCAHENGSHLFLGRDHAAFVDQRREFLLRNRHCCFDQGVLSKMEMDGSHPDAKPNSKPTHPQPPATTMTKKKEKPKAQQKQKRQKRHVDVLRERLQRLERECKDRAVFFDLSTVEVEVCVIFYCPTKTIEHRPSKN